MAEIQDTGAKKANYYIVINKDERKGLYKYIKGDGYSKKVDGLSGVIVDMKIQEAVIEGYDDSFYWIIIMKDPSDTEEPDREYHIKIKENTRSAGSFANLMCTCKGQGARYAIVTWVADKAKGRPVYFAIKENGNKLDRLITEFDEVNKTLKGVPKDSAERGLFWRNKLFGLIYERILGKSWDGVIDPDPFSESREQQKQSNGMGDSANNQQIQKSNDLISKAKSLGYEAFLEKWETIAAYTNEVILIDNLLDKTFGAYQDHIKHVAFINDKEPVTLHRNGKYSKGAVKKESKSEEDWSDSNSWKDDIPF